MAPGYSRYRPRLHRYWLGWQRPGGLWVDGLSRYLLADHASILLTALAMSRVVAAYLTTLPQAHSMAHFTFSDALGIYPLVAGAGLVLVLLVGCIRLLVWGRASCAGSSTKPCTTSGDHAGRDYSTARYDNRTSVHRRRCLPN